MTEQKARRLAKKRLSAKRYQHTLNVRRMAVKLAKRWGADPEKAALAALLHDTAKELPREEMLQILNDNAIMAENAQNRPSPVWHGICAAILAQTQWGVEDEEVLSAIRCHTTGKPGMSLLDEIVFLADMTSAERDYPEVDYLRKLEKKDIHQAMREALEMNLHWLEESGKPVDEETRAALEDLRQRERNVAHE
ncbi:MAG: bis(5'-nucleosyl)-tetraphosphatase (symmetrical) YqeK [Oscillospiraceae bacterium]|nr:bis(5'-nucleosyl)-tetraphosphatase (symmetrical) YqeK [Bacteroidales bacterium]MDD6998643.1 bis(5'-nucleosyl)-tetraphosphatase (symmetrical) YqeK [Oscillospiraceae bacterium]MDY5096558.1 bis(5'-nucleosyl)-tetraphosphatase (symmetrical) YqeK [Oscillospiraceae bacterium]